VAVNLADRMLAVRARLVTADSHGDVTAAGFAAATAAYPGIANIGPDAPPYQPGGRQWTLAIDPALWPVSQQDMVVDVTSGEQWIVLSADLLQNTVFSVVNYVDVKAHSYNAEGSKA
jgi:exo-beta-1,3-glucanase (GH17 family)